MPPPCIPERRVSGAGDAGFATALAMSVSLAVSLTATVLLVRNEFDLIHARHRLERTQAEYRLDAIQALAARAFRNDSAGLKLRRIAFEGLSASVRSEAEQAKLLPAAASKLPDSWFVALGVASPEALKGRLRAWPQDRPLLMQALDELDPSPLWRTCAADVISASGSPPGVAAEVRSGELSAAGAAQTLRLTATADDGWIDDRVVRLLSDAANPVLVLDRRFYRRSDAAPTCPSPPDFGSLT